MAKKILLSLLLFLLEVPAFAQPAIPIGNWRTHFAYQQLRQVIVAKTRIYGIADFGFFYLDQEDNSIKILTKNDGLSDIGIATGAYHAEQDVLIIAYKSGNIDVLYNNQIYPFSLLADANTNEQIHQITFNGSAVYVATSFGVRVLQLDITNEEEPITIKESYTRLNETGAINLPVYSSAIANDSIFLATEAGVIANGLSPLINRLDFSTWKRFKEKNGIPEEPIRFITSVDNTLYAAADNKGLFAYTAGSWGKTSFPVAGTFSSLTSTAEGLLFIVGNQIYSGLPSGAIKPVTSGLLTQPVSAMADNASTFWIADASNGLVSIGKAGESQYFPNGPVTDQARTLYYENNKIVGVSGTYSYEGTPGRNADGFYTFDTGIWTNYNTNAGNLPVITDLVDVLYNPVNQHTYFASFGYGILDWNGADGFTIIDENTEGSQLINNSPPDRFTNISALAADAEGKIWIANYGASNSLHQWDVKNNVWQSYSFSRNETQFPADILVTYNDDKWIRLDAKHGGDILVFNSELNKERYLSSTLGSGGLPGEIVTDMVADNDGQVWVGTNKGVAFFPNPAEVFEVDKLDAIQPIFDRRTLLRDQYITALAIDGGNRKWIGTSNGLWLFSETGEELVSNFTTANSPLISNNITDIAINAQSGEVFIATDRGVISYRGLATIGIATHQEVKIFPNPVRPDFNGVVGISGLAENAIVKVTSISGNLIQEIRAEGGTATWNVNNYLGQRVSSGVYLVFSSSTDGKETLVGKIAIIK